MATPAFSLIRQSSGAFQQRRTSLEHFGTFIPWGTATTHSGFSTDFDALHPPDSHLKRPLVRVEKYLFYLTTNCTTFVEITF